LSGKPKECGWVRSALLKVRQLDPGKQVLKKVSESGREWGLD
jgi:hypothetical protein